VVGCKGRGAGTGEGLRGKLVKLGLVLRYGNMGRRANSTLCAGIFVACLQTGEGRRGVRKEGERDKGGGGKGTYQGTRLL